MIAKRLLAILVLAASHVLVSLPVSRAQVATPISLGADTTSLSKGLIYWAKFDECSGSTVKDWAGTNTGTWHGNNFGGVGNPPLASHYSQGFVGTCAGNFDGSTNYVTTTSPENAGTGQISIAFWMSPDQWNVNYATPVCNTNLASPYASFDFYKSTTSNMLVSTLAIGSTNYTTNVANIVASGPMQFIVLTYDGANIRTYYNGQLQNTTPASGALISSTTNVAMGYNPNFANRWYSGLLDDVRIYSRPLAASEILALYNAQRVSMAYSPVWTDTGTLSGFAAGSWNANAFNESGCTIVSSPCWKLYYGNFNTNDTYYAEAPDTAGVPTFTQYSGNPLITGCNYLKVFENGSTKYVYCSATLNAKQIDVYTCTNNTTCAAANLRAIKSDTNAWDFATVMQIGIAGQDTGGTWWGYYAGYNQLGTTWAVGQAYSSDLIHWTTTGEVASLSAGANWNGSGNLHFQTVGSTVYGWSQTTFLRYSIYQMPSDLMRWSAPSVSSTTWTATGFSTYWRTLTSEDAGFNAGQVADPFLVAAHGNIYLFNSANPGANSSQQINLAIAYGQSFATLVQTNEGVIGSRTPWP